MLKIRPNIPIILCSGFLSAISNERALTIGIKKLVAKPFMRKELACAIRDVLENNDKNIS
jgi:DNA-binding response OmpR family regulator